MINTRFWCAAEPSDFAQSRVDLTPAQSQDPRDEGGLERIRVGARLGTERSQPGAAISDRLGSEALRRSVYERELLQPIPCVRFGWSRWSNVSAEPGKLAVDRGRYAYRASPSRDPQFHVVASKTQVVLARFPVAPLQQFACCCERNLGPIPAPELGINGTASFTRSLVDVARPRLPSVSSVLDGNQNRHGGWKS